MRKQKMVTTMARQQMVTLTVLNARDGGGGQGLLVDVTAVGGWTREEAAAAGGKQFRSGNGVPLQYGTFVSNICEVVRKSLGSS